MVRAVVPMVVVVGIGWLGLAIPAGYGGSNSWQNLFWVSVALVWIVPILLSRSFSVAIFGVFAAGIYLIFMLYGAPSTARDIALTSRGQDVPAVLTSLQVINPCHACGGYVGTVGFPFTATDGSGRHGELSGTKGTHYQVGEHVTVVMDPAGHVQPVDKAQFSLTTSVVLAVISLLIPLAQFYFAAAAWRAKRKDPYDAWQKAHQPAAT